MEFLLILATFVLCFSNYKTLKDIRASVAKLAVFLALAGSAYGQQMQKMELSPDVRAWFHNPDGSCVQCSIGMAGVHCNDLNAASLLWDSPYGKAERLGSTPSRVEAYCDKRGIKAWSVTSDSVEDTLQWLEWAAKTGRFAACGAGEAHFQTVYGRDKAKGLWLVCNNQTPRKIDEYTDSQFKQLHSAVKWVVVLEKPSSLPPVMHNWLK